MKLTQESQEMLAEINDNLAKVVRRAADISSLEFQVLEGKRTVKQQEKLFQAGVCSDGPNPYLYGYAVGLIAVIDNRPILEHEPYDDVAECMKIAATELGIKIKWGGAFHWQDLTTYKGFMEDLTNEYIDRQRHKGARPIVNVHHFELALD